MFEHFTSEAIRVIMLAQEEARRLGHNFVGTEQILLGLMGEGTGVAAKVLAELGVTLKDARREVEKIIGRGSGFVPPEIPFTPKVKSLFEQSFKEAHSLGQNYINTEHLLLGLTEAGEGVAAKVLQNLGVDFKSVRSAIVRRLGENSPAFAGSGSQKRTQPLTMEEYGRNLTKLAQEGRLDPVVGRQKEIERAIQILGRRTKNNPVLIGEPGVGKTAIAEGLAQRIINQDVPETLQNKQVISLDMGSLVAGTRFRGDFEERIKKVVEEVRTVGNIILVIDEIHTLVGAGGTEGGLDAANILKPALARGELQCIGATTLDEYRKHIERDAALERRFQPIKVGEPSVEETVQILYGLRGAYEQHHKVTILDAALVAAAELSDRYISDRFLPDKAIDLIDEAGSRVRLRNSQSSPNKELKRELAGVTKEKEAAVRVQDFDKATQLRDQELKLAEQLQATFAQNEQPVNSTVVDEEDIAQIVASWTGVPVNKLTESESELLLHLEDTLHQRLIGQEQAVTAVSRGIRRARVGLKNPNRPIASFIFSGPTGVGKTELAKALAAYFFGAEDSMIRLDMSEYMESHTVAKLIGSPPGYVGYDEGGQLTEAVRRKPYSVLLFDEIEKAHPDVFNMLLQLLDDGHLTDAKGRKVDFKNTLIILTSNIGSKVIEKGGSGLGFDFDTQADASYNRIRTLVNEELKAYFRPEFLNRLDEIIVFTQLSKNEVKQIAEIMLRDVASRLTERGIILEVSDRFKELVVQEGYNPSYGARPLRRAIMRLLEDSLAEAMLSGEITDGDTALIDVDDDSQVRVKKSEKRELLLASAG